MPEWTITPEALGWNETWQKDFAATAPSGSEAGRVAVEDKHHYIVFASGGPIRAQVTGRLLHESKSCAALPKVGDWVALTRVPAEDKGLIHHVLPRRTKLSRKTVGRQTEEQVLVTNVDIAFLVQALDSSFNPGLLQRHLAMAIEGGVKPVVVLNKADLCADILGKLATAEHVADEAPVVAVSARTGRAMDSLTQLVRPGETVVFVGTSGVGKSTLINQIYGEEIQATAEVRERDSKGRHTTTWRELIVLPGGGLVIDTPGMREFHMWFAVEAAGEAYADVDEVAVGCHFRDCSHTMEKRCAVLAAVQEGRIARERYDSYVKLKREIAFLDTAAQKRQWIDKKRQTRIAQRAISDLKRQESED
jgi:ribosome biogenesis GTPase